VTPSAPLLTAVIVVFLFLAGLSASTGQLA